MIVLGLALIAFGTLFTVPALVPVSLGIFSVIGGVLVRSQKPRRTAYTLHVTEPTPPKPPEIPVRHIPAKQSNLAGAFLRILFGLAAVAVIVCAVVYLR